jgi:hypothetical protein
MTQTFDQWFEEHGWKYLPSSMERQGRNLALDAYSKGALDAHALHGAAGEKPVLRDQHYQSPTVPRVTKQQVLAFMDNLMPTTKASPAYTAHALTVWFNTPDRQVPVTQKAAAEDFGLFAAMERAQKAFAERDQLNATLSELPDYETWFEAHGKESTVRLVYDNRTAATVHEMYTHFRARLLDELRGAGVIGEGS